MIKTAMRILLILIGLGLIWIFSIPATRGIINCGNITGITVGLIFIAFAIFMDKIFALKVSKTGSIVLVACTGIVIVILILAIISSACIFRGARRKPADNAVLVVLGCEVKRETPSLMLQRRLVAAKAYLESHPDAICIVSGGKGGGEDISEAECMYRWLTDNGIDADRIHKEDRSTSTVENLKYSKEILDEIAPGAPIAIATNEFHQYRASKIADKLSIENGAVPADTSWWLWPTYHVREMYAVLYEWVR